MPAAWKLVSPLPTKKSYAGLSLANAVLDACVSSPATGGAPTQPESAVAASDASARRLVPLMSTAAEQAEGQLAATRFSTVGARDRKLQASSLRPTVRSAGVE